MNLWRGLADCHLPVFDWYSAGLVTLAVLLRRFYPQAGGADSTLLRTTLIVGPGAVIFVR
ncbi:hypothetical protein ACLK15_23815 [Escherichia coli]